MLRLIPLLLLASCNGHLHSVVSCENAVKVRTAATLALQALDRACPIPKP